MIAIEKDKLAIGNRQLAKNSRKNLIKISDNRFNIIQAKYFKIIFRFAGDVRAALDRDHFCVGICRSKISRADAEGCSEFQNCAWLKMIRKPEKKLSVFCALKRAFCDFTDRSFS